MRLASLLFALVLTTSGCDSLTDGLNEAFPTYSGGEVRTVTLFSLPTSKPDGSPWDLSGAADPYVEIRNESGVVLYTGETVSNVASDRYPLRWGVSGVRAGMDEDLWVSVYDDDVSEDDEVASYRLRLGDVGGQAEPTAFTMTGPDGLAMGEVEVRWIEAAN